MPSNGQYRYYRGYPARYRRELRRNLIQGFFFLVPIVLFLAFGTWLNGKWVYYEPTILGWIGLIVYGGLFGLFILGFVRYIFGAILFLVRREATYAEIVLYFERPIGLARSHGSSALAKNCQRIDALAIKNNVSAISEFGTNFGLNNDSKGKALQWRDADKGLKTIKTLLGVTGKNPDLLSDSQVIVRDLQQMEFALLKAQAQNIRFCLLLRLGDSRVRPGGLDLYEGSFW